MANLVYDTTELEAS